MRLTVNGLGHEIDQPGRYRLLGYLRGELGLTGAKLGCGEGACGACTVLVGGEPVASCQVPLEQVAGRSVTTVEGLADGDRLHPVQTALVEERASQCGYCTPGMALRAAALLETSPDPSDAEIASTLDPNLCRCGCYVRIVRAVHRAARLAQQVGVESLAPGEDAAPGEEVTAGEDAPPGEEVTRGDPARAPRRGDAHPPDDQVLPRPRRPWDLADPEEREWFEVLGEGLVAVWPPHEPARGTWPANGGAWLHVAPSGDVTAFSGKVNVGQDNTTAFRLLVAEELGVELARVRVVQGDTDFCPFDAGTFGSRSMPDSGEVLRRAAAGAREELARQPLEPGEPRLVVLREEPALTAPTAWRLAGRSGHAAERVDAVTGHRRYVSDLERPGMLHGAVLRPPVPGARLVAFDAGRLATVRGASNPQLVEDGDLVGVLAGDEMLARRGVETLEASFEDRPPGPENIVAHLREHPAEPEGWERALDERVGDVEQALAGSDQVLEESYTTAYLAHTPLETRAAVAEWEGGRLTVWVGTQTPFRVRAQLAGHLGLPEKDVRVIVPPTGGAFGGKHGGDVALEAARLARVAGRPVRVHWSRAEEIVFGYLRPMAVIDVRAGLDSDGRLTAWDFTDYNAGTAGIGFPYRAGAHRIRYQPAASPVAQGSYRALAATANHFARESHLDGLAHLAGVDPLRFRLEHLEDERLAHVLEVAAGRAGWRLTSHADASPTDQPPTNGLDAPGRNDRAVDHNPKGRTGHGLAAGLEKGGRVATCADVSVDEDGSVKVTRIVTAYDCGAIVNPDTVVNQIEGATVMALGGALREAVPVARGRVSGATLVGYEVPRFSDTPQIEVILVDRPDLPPAGAGETPLICVAPAIGNAIFDATSRRVCSLPMLSSGR